MRPAEANRDFYRLAALLAKPDLDDVKETIFDALGLNNEKDFCASRFLESSYQEKTSLYVAQGLRFQPLVVHDRLVNAVVKKWFKAFNNSTSFPLHKNLHDTNPDDCFYLFNRPEKDAAINGVLFSATEQSVLLTLMADEMRQVLIERGKISSNSPAISALSFHQCLIDLLQRKERFPLLLQGVKDGQNTLLLADRVRLFWSHRMHLKSRQTQGGAEPSIRYFHAVFHSSERPRDNVSVLYWLHCKDDLGPTFGEFIENVEQGILPADVFCPRTEICTYLRSESICESRRPLQALLKMYLVSTSAESASVT